MTGLPWRPIISYGTTPTVISLMYPQRLWDYKTQLRGGSRTSSAGIPEAFVTREDNTANIILRVHDCEYLDVRAWINYVQRNAASFTYQFDADDSLSVFTCYLDVPKFEDGFEPKRDPQWPNMWLFPVTIRATTNVPIFYAMAQQCAINSTSVIPLSWVLTNLDASALTGGAGRYILALNSPFGSGQSQLDSGTDTDYTPPISTEDFARSTNPVVSWISRPLTAGYIVPFSAIIGGTSSSSPAATWLRQGGRPTLKHMRGLTVVDSYDSIDSGFSWLGGGNYVTFPMTGMSALAVAEGDQIRIDMHSYYQLQPSVADDGTRMSVDWGAVPGPLTTTRFYATANVDEL